MFLDNLSEIRFSALFQQITVILDLTLTEKQSRTLFHQITVVLCLIPWKYIVFSRRFTSEKSPTITVASLFSFSFFFCYTTILTLIGPLFFQLKLLRPKDMSGQCKLSAKGPPHFPFLLFQQPEKSPTITVASLFSFSFFFCHTTILTLIGPLFFQQKLLKLLRPKNMSGQCNLTAKGKTLHFPFLLF